MTQKPTIIEWVAVKIPPFVLADPELWFSMIDRSFQVSGVTTDDTKFGHILGSLDPRYAAKVTHIIVNPSATDAYATLKLKLTKRLGVSQETKTRQLLKMEEMGIRSFFVIWEEEQYRIMCFARCGPPICRSQSRPS